MTTSNKLGLFTQKALSLAFAFYLFMAPAIPLALLNPVAAEDEAVPVETPAVTETPMVTETPVPTTPAVTEEVTPTIEVTPEATVVPTETPIVTPESTPETSPVVQPSIEVAPTPEPTKAESMWSYNDSNSVTTAKAVELFTTYSIPEVPGFSIRFTKLPETAKPITVSWAIAPKLVDGEKTYGNTYDLSTEMENGSFEYTMRLPRPANKESNVIYTEDAKEYKEVTEVSEASNTVVFTLDHFTTFVVVVPAEAAGALCVGANPNCYTTIQAAINAAVDGDTINIAAGTFTENLTINKSLTILGAGNTAAGTVILKSTNTPLIAITASNVSIGNIRLTPVEVAGIEATASISNLTIDNVSVIGSTSASATENEVGLKVWVGVSVNGLSVANSQFNNLHYGWYFAKNPAATSTDYTSNVTNVTVTNSTFNNNAYKGMYIEKLSNATFTNITVDNNGYNKTQPTFSPNNGGIDLNLKNGNYSNITFNNPTVTNNGTGVTKGKGIAIKGRNDSVAYGLNTTTLTNVTISGGTITGNGGTTADGGGVSIGNYVTGVTISGATISGNNNYGLSNWTMTTSGNPLTTVAIDADGNDWGHISGPADALAIDGSDPISNPGSGNAVIGRIDYTPWVGLDVTAPVIVFSGFRDLANGSYSTTNPIKACGQYNNTGFIAWEWSLGNTEANPVTYTYKIVSGPAGVNYTATTTNTHYHGSIPAQGTYVVQVFGTDSKGNIGTPTQCSITYDTTAPAAPVITAPTGDYYRTAPITNSWTIPADASGIKEYRVEYVYADGHSFVDGPYRMSTTNSRSHTPAITEQGGVTFRVQAIDNAGNYGVWSTTKTYMYDATAPVTTATGIDALWHTSAVTVNFTCDDGSNSSGCDQTFYSVDGSAFVAGNSVVIASDNQHTVAYYSIDRAGNVESTKTSLQTVNIDTIAPAMPTGLKFQNTARTLDIACGQRISPRQAVVPDWNSITGDATFSHYEYTSFHPNGAIGLNEQVMANSEFVNNWMPPTDGAYGYAVRSVDFAGNKSAWALSAKTLAGSCQVIYDTVAPIATISTNRALLFDAQRRVIVTVTYNEPMNTTTTPVVSFSPTAGTFAVYTAGSWVSSTQYQIEYRITDSQEETPDVVISSAGARDVAGNTEAASVTTTIDVDTKNPILSWNTPAANQHISGIVTLSATTSDAMNGIQYLRFRYKTVGAADSTYVTINQSSVAPYDYNWDTTALLDGNYTLRVRSQDGATNFTLKHINVVIDNTVPELTLPDTMIIEATSAAGAVVTFTPTALDEIDGAIDPICDPASGSTFALGTHTVHCTATDVAGNIAEGDFTVIVQDTIPPTVPTNLRFTNPALSCGSYTNVGFITVDWDDSYDAVGVVTYDYAINYPLNGTQHDWQTTKNVSNHSGTLNYGTHYIKVRAKDSAGRTSAWSTPNCSITYDNIAPDVTVTAPANGALVKGTVDIRGTVVDDNLWRYYYVIKNTANQIVSGTGVTVNRNTAFTDMSIFSWNTTAVADGVYTIQLEARDKANNKDAGSVHQITVTVDNTKPVMTFPEIPPQEATDANGRVVDYIVNTTDNIDTDVVASCTPASGSTFAIGNNVINCTATDDAGNTQTGSFNIIVVDTTKPTINDIPDTILNEGDVMPEFAITVSDAVGVKKICYIVTPDFSFYGSATLVDETPSVQGECFDVIPTETNKTWNLSDLIALPGMVNLSVLPEGTFTFEYWSVDTSDNESDRSTTVLTINNVPPTLTLSAVQNADRTFTITANGAGGNSPLAYQWHSGDFAGCSGTNQTVITPNLARSYTCSVTVTDTDGDTVTKSMTVTVDALPFVPEEGEVQGETDENTEEVTPTPTPSTTGEVLGERTCNEKKSLKAKVYIDANKNGNYDNGEKLVSGVKGKVTFTTDGITYTTGEFTSDANGIWSLSLCAGSYDVNVTKESLPTGTSIEKAVLSVSVSDTDAETNIGITLNAEDTKKNTPYWLYILLVILVIGTIGYFMLKNKKEQ